jgi:peptide/nickel transport system ATP-binding protein
LDRSILDVDKLKVNFYTYEGVVRAIDEISFSLEDGDTLGIVGETGCGKSVTVLSILGLVLPPGRIEKGRIVYRLGSKPVTLTGQSDRFMRSIRGCAISMIFQEAGAALNPVLTINRQVSESFLLHSQKELCESVLDSVSQRMEEKRTILRAYLRYVRWKYSNKMKKAQTDSLRDRRYGRLLKKEATRLSIALLGSLGIPNPAEVVNRYPHELSGGMQQRVVIAMALACNPNILIADEPTSNLDVTIQAQILDLIDQQKEKYRSSVLFITHDLGVVSEIARRVIVLYAGTLVELAGTRELFKNPLHPYTKALLNSVPKLGRKERLESIKGNVPNLINPPSGCRFHPRCPSIMEICRREKPGLYRKSDGEGKEHLVSCFMYK